MRIVYVASEITPFASTGGLAEVLGSLPRAVAARGHEVVRIMPLYRQVREGRFTLADTGVRVDIPLGLRRYRGSVWMADEPGPRTYFIARDEFFDRRHLYGTREADYDDNFERFAFFQKAVVEAIDRLELKPDLVHLNDWQTGLIPLFLEHGVRGTRRGRREKVVFTIHNVAYHGKYPGAEFALLNLPFSAFSIETMEYYSEINFLKAGIMCADAVTTVSETYRQEIQTRPHGRGLEGVLAAADRKLQGIVNGIDTDLWNPATDPLIARTFDAARPGGKASCRRQLIQEFGLAAGEGTLVLGLVSRLTGDKGIDLLKDALPALMERNLAVAILGSGESEFEAMLGAWPKQWPERVGVRLKYDRDLARRIVAGADAFLMPSKEEPCGLNQLYSMRYGTLPIVRSVGGLADTVQNLDPDAGTGTGFVFAEYDAASLVGAVDRALAVFRDRPRDWLSAMQRAMTQDWSWARSATRYLEIYERLAAAQTPAR
jgi:starch synthase